MEARDSQVIGSSGCDRGLLGHVSACARMLVCMLGCLSNLVVVGFFEEKRYPPLAVARTSGSSLPLLPALSFLPPCPDASRLRRNTVSRHRPLDTSLQKVVPRALKKRALLQLALLLPHLLPVHHALAAAS